MHATRTARLLAALVASAALAAPATAAVPGQLSVSVSPPSVTLLGGEATTLSVRNTSGTAAWVAVSTGNFDITSTGVVRVDPKLTPSRSAKAWLKVSPTRLRLAAGATAKVTVAAKPSRVAAPGDHQALVLFTTAGSSSSVVTVKARVGVSVLVRVGGPLRRAIGVAKPVVRRGKTRRVMSIRVANNGNITERLLRKSVRVSIRAGRRTLVLTGARTTLLPGTKRVLKFAVPRTLTGRATVTVRVTPLNGTAAGASAPRARRTTKRFRVNLG